MIFSFSILSFFFIFVKSPVIDRNIPLRIDCYQSLSFPYTYMAISHYNPSGPLYLYSTFYYNRYSNLLNNKTESKHAEYSFKRVNRRCKNSVIFTTLGKDFKKMDVTIVLFLSKHLEHIAMFDYTFFKGFNPGIHELRDINGNFKVNVKVVDEDKNYLGVPVHLENETLSYLKSIKTQNAQLCVITRYSKAVVLEPYYGSEAPFGVIFGFQAMIFREGIYLGERNYSAYECQKYITYPDKQTIFITDGVEFSIKFRVIYRQYFPDVHEYAKEFELSNPVFGDVYKVQNIYKKYEKLFCIKKHVQYMQCKDGSFAKFYYSEDGKKYLADLIIRIKTFSYFEYSEKLYTSPENPCAE